LINGKEDDYLSERTLFWEWGRGYPVMYRNIAALKGDYKLVGNCDHDAEIEEFELYNLKQDPNERKNLVLENKEIAESMKSQFDNWIRSTTDAQVNRKVHRMKLGTVHENPVVLNRNDAKGITGVWKQDDLPFYWDISIMENSEYTVKAKFYEALPKAGQLYVRLYPYHFKQGNSLESNEIKMDNLLLSKGDYKLEVYYKTGKGNLIFPFWVSVENTRL